MMLGLDEWEAVQEAMLFCTEMVRPKVPETHHFHVEFQHYVIEKKKNLVFEARLTLVMNRKRGQAPEVKDCSQPIFASTGDTYQEVIWDLIGQVGKEIQVRRKEGTLPAAPKHWADWDKRRSNTVSLKPGGQQMTGVMIELPKGTWLAPQHGPGCGCFNCRALGRVPN